jgi:glycosyltransferase involved in cell wall biosynthesis
MDYFGIKAEKIKVIYQGCAPVFKEECSEVELTLVKEKYNLPDVFLLNVGTIEERKNILTVIQAINKTDIKLVIIGKKSNYYKTISNYISENSMSNQVIFLENVPLKDLSIIYRLAKIFTYPSIFKNTCHYLYRKLFCRSWWSKFYLC